MLDTNVVSELRRRASGGGDPSVRAWDEALGDQLIFLSAVTILEVHTGVLLKRRKDPGQADVFHRWLHDQIIPTFADRILPVDTKVALVCAALHVPVTRPRHDALIAATALAHGLTLATRNIRDFTDMGVRLVNPWDYRVGTGSAPA